jgi:hypothetical protein
LCGEKYIQSIPTANRKGSSGSTKEAPFAMKLIGEKRIIAPQGIIIGG